MIGSPIEAGLDHSQASESVGALGWKVFRLHLLWNILELTGLGVVKRSNIRRKD